MTGTDEGRQTRSSFSYLLKGFSVKGETEGFLFQFSLLRSFQLEAIWSLYEDTGQGTAQRLDNPAELPLGGALPRHILISINTSNELQKKKNVL